MKILVIRFSSLGDIILLSPVFREIKKFFPEVETTFITAREFANVYSESPYISNIYIFDKDKWGEISRARQYIRQEKFDIIFDAHCSLRSILVRCFSGATVFKTVKRSFRRYSLIYWKMRSNKKILSQREAYLKWLNIFTEQPKDSKSEFFLQPIAVRKIKTIFSSYLLDSRRLVVIAMGARYFNKCWPAPYWYDLVQRLKNSFWQVVLIGTNADKKLVPDYNRVAKKCSMDFTGQLSLHETAALLSKANILVCGDSAPLHLAEAVGTPVVAIFGPTTADFGFAPHLEKSHILEASLPCKPCSAHGKTKCKNKKTKECMHLITATQVYQKIQQVIENEN